MAYGSILGLSPGLTKITVPNLSLGLTDLRVRVYHCLTIIYGAKFITRSDCD